MNDREVLQALLDGKVIVDESSWHVFYYKPVSYTHLTLPTICSV